MRNGRYKTKDAVCWYLNGELHREDGPAIERPSGDKEWYLNGKRHREDGPAIEFDDGDKFWYLDGKRHCEAGPAIECANGDKAWYLEGIEYSEQEFNVIQLKKKLNSELPEKQFDSKKNKI